MPPDCRGERVLTLCVVGSLLGRHPGYIVTQPERLAALFEAAGHRVIATSSELSRLPRMADVLRTMWRHRREIDLVVMCAYSGRAFILTEVATAMARVLKLPLVVSLHGGGLPEMIERGPDWTRSVIARGKVLVSQSEFIARPVRDLGRPLHVIPNVLDTSGLPYRERTKIAPRLLWMRKFHRAYDPDLAVHALAHIKKEFPDASLVMAGRLNPVAEKTRALAESLGLADAVRFPGFVSGEDKHRLAMEADIFLNTNRVDNRPLSVLEAVAMGLPVIATSVGGIPDMLTNEVNALLVPTGDVEAVAQAVAQAVHRLVCEPGLAARLSAAGRLLPEASSPARVLAAWTRVFDEAMGDDHVPTR